MMFHVKHSQVKGTADCPYGILVSPGNCLTMSL